MELKIEQQVRGTRILLGESATQRRNIGQMLSALAKLENYQEIALPLIEPASLYTEKAGTEILSQMYVFPDKKDRQLCLRPEGTATCQILAETLFKMQRDVKVWYITTCWRYEKPQAGRYREFQQFGCEWLNPRKEVRVKDEMIALAERMTKMFTSKYEINASVKRGLAYYIEDGFEIICPNLGAQKQICGGGSYKQGCGFAFGIDRMMLVK
jgi:histidyl-tRNA synthetase